MIGEVLAGLLLGPSLLGPEFSGWILPSLAEAVEELTSTAEELHAVNAELTEAQRVAHASQQRYQELFDGVPEAYLVTDLQGPAGWPPMCGEFMMDETSTAKTPMSALPLPLERDLFLRTLIRELAGVLEDVVGLEEASGFISVVGQRIGLQFDRDYKAALQVSRLTRTQVADVLVDLKRRIRGDFFVIAQDDEKIVLGNRACPFGDTVLGRRSMCMMTSNVFGGIAAENLGYAKVVLQETIAQGHPGCRVVVYLQPTAEAEGQPGREYVKGDEVP